ncbi:zinc-binding dehydrogenase [Actinomadura rudentiformis]|uniref:zinc-binding dehydrogenase n=1 Tax=Actinomadura rudentiformis TaxID=359158 RepID=UPI00298F452A|nr:zinc-binding dehydrogenase [Actinomadura rudentiformis]
MARQGPGGDRPGRRPRRRFGSRAQFIAMNRAVEVNRLKPVIDRVFSFDDAPGAYRYYASGRAFGKVVITLNADSREGHSLANTRSRPS